MKQSDVPIISYSDISTISKNPETVLLNEFERQIDYLRKNSFTTIALHQLAKYLDGKGELPEKPIIILFDGAKQNFLQALEILKNNSFGAAMIIDPATVGTEGFLGWSQLLEVRESNKLLEFSCFGDVKRITEIKKEVSEKLGAEPKYFSYSLKSYDDYELLEKIKNSIKGAGFEAAITARDTLNNRFLDKYELSRRLITRKVFFGKFIKLLKSPTISVCMIAKNEENCIGNALESVRTIADEIVLVDTGSIDRTKEIAAGYGAKIIDYVWEGDFSKARNIYLKHAASDWILSLDADEIIDKKDLVNIKRLTEMEFDAYTLVQYNYSDNENDAGFVKNERFGAKGYLPSPLVRLFMNKAYRYSGQVHESIDKSLIQSKAKIGNTDIPIHHLDIFKGKEALKEKQLAYLEYSKKKLESNPDDIKTLCDIGLIYMNFLDNFEEAEKHFNMAIGKAPADIRPIMLLGQLYVKQNNYEGAIKAYSTALEVESDNAYAKQNIEQIKKFLKT